LNSDDLEDELRQEKTWDFGVDFNLNEDSSFSIGLQVMNSEFIQSNENSTDEEETDSEDTQSETINTSNEESTSVEASFKIKF
jgi:hypothetical protein